MRVRFNEQLRELNDELIHMGNMIEQAIEDSINALFARDAVNAKRIMEEDVYVDQEQKKIENICFQLQIQQQPVAKDLRFITAAAKIVTDMERIGDQAADIAELTIMMADSPYQPHSDHIREMAAEAEGMLIKAIDAYVERDMKKAQEVIDRDDVVDELFVTVKAELIEIMRKNADYAEYAADLLMVNKYLERIGDHATNIAEWVIFSNSGHVL